MNYSGLLHCTKTAQESGRNLAEKWIKLFYFRLLRFSSLRRWHSIVGRLFHSSLSRKSWLTSVAPSRCSAPFNTRRTIQSSGWNWIPWIETTIWLVQLQRIRYSNVTIWVGNQFFCLLQNLLIKIIESVSISDKQLLTVTLNLPIFTKSLSFQANFNGPARSVLIDSAC